MEYAEIEAAVKDFPLFRDAMKKRGVEDMDLVMVDAWLVGYTFQFCRQILIVDDFQIKAMF